MFGTVYVFINDPDALEDLYIKKNAAFNKHEIERLFAKPLFTNNIVTMETDDP